MARLMIKDLLPGSKYYIQFRAIGVDSFSEWSRKFELITTSDTTPPDIPEWAEDALIVDDDAFIATWLPIDIFDGEGMPIENNADFSHYELSISDGTRTVSLLTTNTSYTLTFEMNKGYFGSPRPEITMKVRSVDRVGNASAWNEEKTAQNPRPENIASLTGTPLYDAIQLDWPVVSDTDVNTYRIQMSTTGIGGTYNTVYQGPNNTYTQPSTAYFTDHYFRVVAIDKFNQTSIAYVTTGPVKPKNSINVDITPPPTPTSLAASITNNTNGVGARAALTWVMASPPSDLAGYYVRYRRVGDTNYSTVTFTSDALAGIVELQLAYVNYEFQIKAFDWQNNESSWSSTVTATAPGAGTPAQITGVASTAGRTDMRYTWTAASEANVNKYEITFSTSSTFASGNITFYVTTPVLVVSGLIPGTTYYARVRAINVAGTTGSWSSTDTKATLGQLTPGDIGAPTDSEFDDLVNVVEGSIKGYVTEYAVNSSETVPPSSGWSTSTPTRTPGSFIWYRVTVTYNDNSTSTTSPALMTGNTGSQGDPGEDAKSINFIATSQVMVSPSGGGTTSPATIVVQAYPVNTSVTDWQYAVDGSGFSYTLPDGVVRGGNAVTITGASMTAKTISIMAQDADGTVDTITVAKVENGADGDDGSQGDPGADAYTVLLTNEANVFAGDISNALAGSTTSQVIAYKGSTQQSATIGTITGQVTGLTTSISNNGTTSATITITVTTSLTTQKGELTIPITVDGKTFTKKFSWSVAYNGTTGATGVGISSVTPYYQTVNTGSSAPAKPTVNPPGGSWVTTEPDYVSGKELYRTDRILYTNSTFAYTDVTKVSSYTAAITAITAANGKNKIIFSTGDATGTSYTDGDIWYKKSGTQIIAMWEFTTSWQSRTLRDEVLSSLNVGKLTAGDISAITINMKSTGVIKSDNYSANSAGWKLDASGLEINNGKVKAETLIGGTLTSTTGVINIGSGASIVMNGGYIKSNTNSGTSMATAVSSGTGFYLGNDGLFIGGGANGGQIKANAIITDTLTSTTITLGSGGSIVGGSWTLSDSGLSIPNGGIDAAKLNIQSSTNLIAPQWADFEFAFGTDGSYYDKWISEPLNFTNATASIDTTDKKYNSQSMKVVTSNTSNIVYLCPAANDSNTWDGLIVEPSKIYIVSYWAMIKSGATASTITPYLVCAKTSGNDQQSNGAGKNVVGGSTTVAADGVWKRYYTTITASANSIGRAFLRFSSSAVTTYYIDGIQIEEKMSNSDLPSTWSPPGSTNIDGGIIKTGEIRSSTKHTINGVDVPIWAIDTSGSAVFGQLTVRGSAVVGSTADDGSTLQSAGYVPGISGWSVNADGSAEFRNVVIDGSDIEPGTLDVDAIKSGSILADKTINVGPGGSLVVNGLMGEEIALDGDGFHVMSPYYINISTIAISSNTLTVVTVSSHGFAAGNKVVISGTGTQADNGLGESYTILSTPAANSFTCAVSGKTNQSTTSVSGVAKSFSTTISQYVKRDRLINFPSDGANPNIISGALESDNLTVTTSGTYMGSHHLVPGALWTVDSNTVAPFTAPQVTAVYDDKSLKPNVGSVVGYGFAKGSNGNHFVIDRSREASTGKWYIDEYDTSGNFVANRYSHTLLRRNQTYTNPWGGQSYFVQNIPGGLVYNSTSNKYYVLITHYYRKRIWDSGGREGTPPYDDYSHSYNDYVCNITNLQSGVTNESMARDASLGTAGANAGPIVVSSTNNSSSRWWYSTIGWDHVGNRVIYAIQNSNLALQVGFLTMSSGNVSGPASSYIPLHGNTATGMTRPCMIARVNNLGDVSADRVIIKDRLASTPYGYGDFMVWNSTGGTLTSGQTPIQTNVENWPAAYGKETHGGYYDTSIKNFVALQNNNGIVTYQSGDSFWATGTEMTSPRYIGYSWYDSDGTTHETDLSPITTFNLPKRARIKVDIAKIPYLGNADSPNRARIYVAAGASQPSLNPASSNWHLRDEIIQPGKTINIIPETTPSGAKPRNTGDNGFAGLGSSPGLFVSQKLDDNNDPVFSLAGNGDGRMGPYSWSGNDPHIPAILLGKSAAQALTGGTTTTINYNSVIKATGGMTASGGEVTVPKTGWYDISGDVTFQATTVYVRLILFIFAGGNYIASSTQAYASGTSSFRGESVSGKVWLNAGDTVAIRANTSTGWGMDISQSYMNHMSVVFIGN